MEVIYSAARLGLDLNKKIYECSVCKKMFNWDANCSWYGSLKQYDEDPSKLIVVCSDNCKNKYDDSKRV